MEETEITNTNTEGFGSRVEDLEITQEDLENAQDDTDTKEIVETTGEPRIPIEGYTSKFKELGYSVDISGSTTVFFRNIERSVGEIVINGQRQVRTERIVFKFSCDPDDIGSIDDTILMGITVSLESNGHDAFSEKIYCLPEDIPMWVGYYSSMLKIS